MTVSSTRSGARRIPTRPRQVTSEVRGPSAAVEAAEHAGNPHGFLEQLNALRESLGLSYTQIGTKAGKGMSRSTAHAMLTGDDLPTLAHLRQFLRACRISQDEVTRWIHVWERLSAQEREPPSITAGKRTQVAVTTEPDPVPSTPQPAAPPPNSDPGVSQPAKPDWTRARIIFMLRALAATTALTVVLSGSGIAMWLTGVPTEVIITVYAVVTVCVVGWTVVARYYRPQPEYTPQRYDDGFDLFDDLPPTYPPTLGS